MKKLFVKIIKKLNNYVLNVEFETESKCLCFLGGTGSGKSIILKCIAGIETPDSGIISYGDKVLYNSLDGVNIKIQKRKMGYFFQNYALFPNMTVYQNVFCSVKSDDKNIKKEKTIDILKQMDIYKIQNSYPHMISGGEKQRTALARIIVSDPEILLLDEPFSAIDAYLKWTLHINLKKVINELNKNVILVSHDKDEVYSFADEVIIIKDGVIIEKGTKESIYNNSNNKYTNILIGKIKGE